MVEEIVEDGPRIRRFRLHVKLRSPNWPFQLRWNRYIPGLPICLSRDALPSKPGKRLFPAAVLLTIAVIVILVSLVAPPTPSDPMADDDDAAGLQPSDSLDALGTSWFLFVFAIPLRIRRERLLDNPTRKALYGLVQAHPGIHLRGIVHATGFGFGAVSYHLHVLQASGLISASPSGLRVCFYPMGVEPLVTIPPISRRRVQILEAVGESPGVGLGQIGEVLGLSRKSVAYHIRALRAAGLVEAERSGRPLRLRCSPLEGTIQGATRSP